ncbi:MAG: Crp/Fnr family transcriptional regulator [Bacteroidota bacterium]|nr:Crp/Fnr family transcriptional regulator [Bacteroidota bacterium]
MDAANCTSCDIKSKAVETLDDKELDFLNHNCAEVVLKKNEHIIKEGTLSSHIAYIKSGLAKIHMTGPSGKDQILRLVPPGYYIGIQTILFDKVHRYSATALKPSRVCYIDILSFKELIKRNHQFAYELILYLCQNEMSYYNRFVNQFQKQLNGRLADALIYFANTVSQSDEFEMPLSRTDLGALIGATRESVSRAIHELMNIGVIRMDGKMIQIKNYEMLNKISKSG